MNGGEGQSTGLTYSDWADLLAWQFFKDQNAGQPVTLFVDDAMLGALCSSEPSEAVDSLVGAVRLKLGTEARNDLFTEVTRDARRWQESGFRGSPPSLPLLAAAVLAATRMAREGEIRPTNYYRRFRQVLGLTARSGTPRGYAEAFPALWNQMRRWMDDVSAGQFGRSTIRPHPTFSNIGYALSQALFRAADRVKVAQFFVAAGLSPGDRASPQVLADRFREWAHRETGLSPGARRLAADPTNRSLLEEILEAALETWTGTVVDEAGRRAALIRLTVTFPPFDEPRFAFLPERPDGLGSSLSATGSDTGTIELVASLPSYFDELNLDVSSARLGAAWGFIGDGVAWSYRPAALTVLAQSDELGCWISIDHIQAGVEQCLFVEPGALAEKVTIHLSDAGAAFQPPRTIPANGYTLIRGVFIPGHAAPPSDPDLAGLALPIRSGPSLRGGLLLWERGPTYLADGEPDLLLPDQIESGNAVVAIDGRQHEGVTGPGSAIALSGLSLEPGPHEVVIGTTSLKFSTVRQLDQLVPGDSNGPRLGRVLEAGSTFEAGQIGAVDGAPAIVGSVLIGGRSRQGYTVRLPIGPVQYVVLGAIPGEVMNVRRWRPPAWIRNGEIAPTHYAVDVPFNPAVVLMRWRAPWSGTSGSVLPPAVTTLTRSARADVVAWANWIRKSATYPQPSLDPGKWSEYRQIASGILDGT